MLFIVVILIVTLLNITTKIDELYMKMCSIMMQCSSTSNIPTSKVKTSGEYVVPGFNEYAKELHKEARSCFIAWKSLGKPRAGLCYTDMCQSRLRFKSILKHCQRNEDSLYALTHLPNLICKKTHTHSGKTLSI